MKTGDRPGRNVERILAERGMSQVALARLLKITPGGVNHILTSSKWHVETLLKMSKALGVKPGDIDKRFA